MSIQYNKEKIIWDNGGETILPTTDGTLQLVFSLYEYTCRLVNKDNSANGNGVMFKFYSKKAPTSIAQKDGIWTADDKILLDKKDVAYLYNRLSDLGAFSPSGQWQMPCFGYANGWWCSRINITKTYFKVYSCSADISGELTWTFDSNSYIQHTRTLTVKN